MSIIKKEFNSSIKMIFKMSHRQNLKLYCREKTHLGKMIFKKRLKTRAWTVSFQTKENKREAEVQSWLPGGKEKHFTLLKSVNVSGQITVMIIYRTNNLHEAELSEARRNRKTLIRKVFKSQIKTKS